MKHALTTLVALLMNLLTLPAVAQGIRMTVDSSAPNLVAIPGAAGGEPAVVCLATAKNGRRYPGLLQRLPSSSAGDSQRPAICVFRTDLSDLGLPVDGRPDSYRSSTSFVLLSGQTVWEPPGYGSYPSVEAALTGGVPLNDKSGVLCRYFRNNRWNVGVTNNRPEAAAPFCLLTESMGNPNDFEVLYDRAIRSASSPAQMAQESRQRQDAEQRQLMAQEQQRRAQEQQQRRDAQEQQRAAYEQQQQRNAQEQRRYEQEQRQQQQRYAQEQEQQRYAQEQQRIAQEQQQQRIAQEQQQRQEAERRAAAEQESAARARREQESRRSPVLDANRSQPYKVTFFNQGGYVARFMFSYRGGPSETFSIPVGQSRSFSVPFNAEDLMMRGDASGLSWIKIFHYGPGGDGERPQWTYNVNADYRVEGICIKTWGTLFGVAHGRC